MLLPPGRVYVFDVDGVLVDASERLREALERVGARGASSPDELEPWARQRFWELFLSEELLALDRPREVGIRLLLDRLGRGVVLVLTGRPYRLYRVTLRELSGFGVPVEKVILSMRPRGDRRRDVEFKASVLARIPDVAEVHDDEPGVLEAARRLHPGARLFLHRGDSYELVP
ncbi:hypothetical protein IG193_08890 [Infirmifilum lucidum]|uniref:Haloacid dehalogenase n=1 Tax=Infirmifilum lucidum TaxID=2776706 RepID=A0A7L9FJ72_9CREN|nr:hypothetical protein [Infirmifilum lucidum]QOJ78845.1 hypothetical protein IG193_08890 [Infirmifilum lucidum]